MNYEEASEYVGVDSGLRKVKGNILFFKYLQMRILLRILFKDVASTYNIVYNNKILLRYW